MRTFLPAGTQIAGYRVESIIGRGGMAVVYRAEHVRLGRKVALKLIAPELSENEEFRRRFMRESQLAAAIDHPNVLPVYEADEADGMLFIAMRYVDGTDLKGMLLEQRRLDTGQVLSIFPQMARALDVAHGRGLIHRDVKPGNILLMPGPDDEPDHVYLSDFGLTKRASSHSGLTATGQFVGTIDYVAPEQIMAKPVGPSADIYALGCVLFECLTGTVPFDRETDAAILFAHLNDPPPEVTSYNPILPTEVDGVVATAMAKSPEDRFSSCRQLVQALQAALGSGAPPAISGPRAVPAPVQEPRPPEPATFSTQVAEEVGQAVAEDVGSAVASKSPAPSRPGPGRPDRRRRLLVLVAVVVLLVAASAGALLLRGRGSSTRFAATDQVPFSFTHPSRWTEHDHGLFTLLSPENLIDFFAGGEEAWTALQPLLANDAEQVVGVYLPNGTDTLDVRSPQEVAVRLAPLLPGEEKIGSHQPVKVDGHDANRVQGQLEDPRHPGVTLAFVDYAIQIRPGEAVHLVLFGPDEQTLQADNFSQLVDSVRLDPARVAAS